MPLQVWKIPLNSQRSPDFAYSPKNPAMFEQAKAEQARQFCFNKSWVGIGWGIDGLDCDLDDHNDYITALDNPPGKILFSRNKAVGPSMMFANQMQCGDFIWCRASGDIYWVGRVVGPWRYRHSDDFAHFDLYQVRECKWVRVGPSDLVPGPVKNAYAGRGRTVSRILTEGDAALLGSALIWESETGEFVEHNINLVKDFPLGAIGHDDLEDIVSLYLQMEMGWHIIPSTVKRSTPVTEFVLRNRAGKRSYIQVKSGQTSIDSTKIIIPKNVDSFFIFYPTIGEIDNPREADPRLIYLSVEKITAFVKANRGLMPNFVQLLLR